MTAWVIVICWGAVHMLQAAFAVRAFRAGFACKPANYSALKVSLAASVVPVITLLLFLRVFAIGRTSHVAQLAGEPGLELWRMWAGAWGILALADLIAFVAALVAVILRPSYPIADEKQSVDGDSFASRVCAVVAAAWALSVVFSYFPDA